MFDNPTKAALVSTLGPDFRTLRQGAYELVVAGLVAFEEVEHEQASTA